MKNSNNQIDKALNARGDLSETKKLDLLASENLKDEKFMSDFMDMKYEEARDKFLQNNPDKTEDDFIKLLRVPMESGGRVIDFAKYAKIKDPKIKKISLASLFTPGKALSELTESERDVVNNLLKMTFGKKD
jgi:hypothetical protein|tara:strand:+ start:190 stop:585 length:396 start_codon:yes stop_codon:yes gene_type:complete